MVSSPPSVTVDRRWYVIQQDGDITSFDPSDPGPGSTTSFLDISDRTLNDTGETGLLGMALHPDFPEDPRAFVFLHKPG